MIVFVNTEAPSCTIPISIALDAQWPNACGWWTPRNNTSWRTTACDSLNDTRRFVSKLEKMFRSFGFWWSERRAVGCATSKGAFLAVKLGGIPWWPWWLQEGHLSPWSSKRKNSTFWAFSSFFCWWGRRRNGFIRGVVRTRHMWPNISKGWEL